MDNKVINPVMEYDEVKLFFREDYTINNFVTVYQPTIGDITEYGERKYYSMICTLCAIPSDMKSILWDNNIDWNELSDFKLFIMISSKYSKKETYIITGDFDLTEFVPMQNSNGELFLYNSQRDLYFRENDYKKFVGYIRKIHGLSYKKEKAKNKFTRDILIQEDRVNLQFNKKKPYVSQLKNMISAMLVYPGFKYKSHELKECGIYEFMDAVKRSQIFVNATALLNGMYSGMIDTKKINSEKYDWLRDISKL